MLIEEEQLNIWAAVGVSSVYRTLDALAKDFRGAFFISDEDPTTPVVMNEDYLRNPMNWVSQAVASPSASATLCIGLCDCDIEPVDSATSFVKAVRMWGADEWSSF